MGRRLLIVFVLLSFIFLNIGDTFGDDRCIYLGRDYTDDPRNPYHICKKLGSNFCYFPEPGYETLALHLYEDKDGPARNTLTEKFHEKHGGCHLSIGYPQNRIWANFEDTSAIRYFIYFCGGGNYFSTKMDITYEAYDKGNPIPQTYEKLRDENIFINGYRLDRKINEFKSAVNGVSKYIYNSYNREIYTLRVKEAIITDDKCPTKHKIEDRPISVATKLLLELKLNADDRIVYDDKETKKIEVNADQDEFYFGGTLQLRYILFRNTDKAAGYFLKFVC